MSPSPPKYRCRIMPLLPTTTLNNSHFNFLCPQGDCCGGRGGGVSHITGRGCLLEILKRSPQSYQDAVLWVWLKIFSPIRGTDSHITLHLLSYFSTQCPKKYCKSSHCGLVEDEQPKTAILTSETVGAPLPGEVQQALLYLPTQKQKKMRKMICLMPMVAVLAVQAAVKPSYPTKMTRCTT